MTMRKLSIGIVASAFCVLAMCSGCASQPPDVEGVLQLPLQATTAAGHVYRLKNATFQITGAAIRTLSSEASVPTATSVLANLPIGSYTIALQPGWTLARLDGAGTEQTVSAQLVSAGTMPFSIQSQQLTPVTFTFETDGTVVMMGEGTLGVNIAVNERD